MLAVADGDGVVRLYEAEEPLDAESWPMVDSFRATAAGECTCLTWREATVEGDRGGRRERQAKVGLTILCV